MRAYPSSEGGGSDGQTFTAELRHRLNAQWSVMGFYDWGAIKVNHVNYNATSPNAYHLAGYGASAVWHGSQNIDLKLTVAQRIGTNPAPSLTGTDSDGTKRTPRWWLNATWSF